MSDEECESLACKFSTTGRELSGAELLFFAELDSIKADTPDGIDQMANLDQVRIFIERWREGDPARLEELKNSPLIQHWRKLDKDRKAKGYAVYNLKRRRVYALKVLFEEDRIVTRYVTGLSDVDKTSRRNKTQAANKAKRRAAMTPEQKAAESAKRAARRAKNI